MYLVILLGVVFTNGLCANLRYGDSTDRNGYSLNYPSTASSLYSSDLYKTSRLSNEVSPYSPGYTNYNSYSTDRYNSNGGYSTPSYGSYSPSYSSSGSLYNSVSTSRYGEGYGTGYGTTPSYGLGIGYGSSSSSYGLAGQSYGAGSTYGSGQSYGTNGVGSYGTGQSYGAGQSYGSGYGSGQSYGSGYGSGQSYGSGYGAGQTYGAGGSYGAGQTYGASGTYGSGGNYGSGRNYGTGGSYGAGQSYGSGLGSGYGQGSGSYGSYGGYNSRGGEYTSYERPLMSGMSGMGQYCVNRSPQMSIRVDSLMGMWYGVEYIQHSGGFGRPYAYDYDYQRTCIVMHLSEPIEQPSTDNVVHHVQHLKAKLRQEYRHLRLLWDEGGQTIEYALYFRNDSAGYWQVFDRQNGSLTAEGKNYQQFTGTIQVLKAVNHHIVLNFCQEPTNGRPAQLYSVLFSREPGQMLPWELDSVHNMLQSKQLSVASRRMVCGNSSASKVLTSFVMTIFVGILASILGRS